jgi:hypothetical protein
MVAFGGAWGTFAEVGGRKVEEGCSEAGCWTAKEMNNSYLVASMHAGIWLERIEVGFINDVPLSAMHVGSNLNTQTCASAMLSCACVYIRLAIIASFRMIVHDIPSFPLLPVQSF